MPQGLKAALQAISRAFIALSRKSLALWVRARVLPRNPELGGVTADNACYVLEMRSFSNYLVLEHETLKHQLPFAGGGGTRVVAMQRRRGWVRRRETHAAHLEALSRLLERAARGEEVKLVPVSIFWGRRPQREDSLFKALFSDAWAVMGPIRKFFMVLLHGRHVLVQFNAPISLSAFVAANPDEGRRLRKLSRVLRVHFRRQRTATIGPDLSHRRTLVNSLLSSRPVRDAIEREASKKRISRRKAQARAHKYAMEIAADYSYPVIRALDHILSWVWNRLFDGLAVNHFDTVRDAAPGNELVYVPCHRSHMDYLLLSYVLYHQGLVPPHVAAGLNLNIPIIGGILRRGGAFFIRRSFNGNQLYTAVVNEYIAMNFAKGVSLEYFTEGTRSRTGRLLKAREGMLALSAKSYLRHPERPVVFVPVYVGYEKVIELRSYVEELSGDAKKAESVGGFFMSLRALWHKWGRVYINVGEPVALHEVFARHNPDWRREADAGNHRPPWMAPAVTDLARKIHTHINQAAAVNPVNLVSLALVSNPKHALDEGELARLIDVFRFLIRSLPDHGRVTVSDMKAEEIITYVEGMRLLQREPHELGDVLYLDARNSLHLTYYRNNCLHLLALPSLIACCFQYRDTVPWRELMALCRRAYPLLRAELFLPWDDEALEGAMKTVRAAMVESGLLTLDGGDVQVSERSAERSRRARLNAVAHPLLPILQRLYLCAALLAREGSGKMTQQELEQLCRLTGQRLALLHEFHGSNIFQNTQYRHFIGLLRQRGWVWVNGGKLEFGGELHALNRDAECILSPAIRERLYHAQEPA